MSFKTNKNISKEANLVNRELFGCRSKLTEQQKKSVFLEDVCPDPKKPGRKKGSKNKPKHTSYNPFEWTTTLTVDFAYSYI